MQKWKGIGSYHDTRLISAFSDLSRALGISTEVGEAEPEEASLHEEQLEVDLGQSIDAWPEVDQLLEDMFAPRLPKE